MKKYKDYQEIADEYGDDIVIIEYPLRWGGQFADKSFWCAFFWKTQDVYDYHTKKHLIKELTEKGYKWIVVRNHVRGNRGISILGKSEQLIATPLNSKGSQEANSLNISLKETGSFPNPTSRTSLNNNIMFNKLKMLPSDSKWKSI